MRGTKKIKYKVCSPDQSSSLQIGQLDLLDINVQAKAELCQARYKQGQGKPAIANIVAAHCILFFIIFFCR
jgi:hypothetical protein